MTDIAPAISARTARARRRDARSIWREPIAVLGVVLVSMWTLVAIFAPWIAPHAPLEQSADLFQAPSAAHPFGTDELGRDLLSRILWGARTSLPLAVAVVGIALTIGGALGALAGYLGGLVDACVMRLVELVFAFPTIILAMAVAAAFGPSARNAVVALVIVSWPIYARVIRGAVLSVRHEEYVNAARLLGASAPRALATDVLPNIVGPTFVLATLELGNAILLLSSLSFLGLGIRPPTPEWGSMVASGAQNFSQWWIGTFAGVAIMTLVLGFNLLGDTLRDRLDPRFARTVEGRR